MGPYSPSVEFDLADGAGCTRHNDGGNVFGTSLIYISVHEAKYESCMFEHA